MNAWDKTKPLPSEYISTFYDYLRNFLELFEDRFGIDHNMDGVLDTTLVTADGYHNQLTMMDYYEEDEYNNPIYYPWYTEDSQQLFVKEIDGLHELCIQTENGIFQITKNGNLFGVDYYDDWIMQDAGKPIYGIYANNIFVGFNGINLYTSYDGINWTQRTSAYPSNELRQIIYSDGIFVAVHLQSKISTSSDGINWTGRLSETSDGNVLSVSYGNGFFITGGTYGRVYKSTDGISWTKVRDTTGNYQDTITEMFFNNGVFLSIGVEGEYRSYISSDGVNWARVAVSEKLHSCFIYNNIFYAYASISSYYSLDGVNWNSFSSNYDDYEKVQLRGYISGFVTNAMYGKNVLIKFKKLNNKIG